MRNIDIMRNVNALLIRPDNSKAYLNNYKSQGYITVVFVANIAADPECEYLNGNVYNIDELLILDNPLFRMSHPNCRCKFDAFGKAKQQVTTTPSGPPPPTITEETTNIPSGTPTEQQVNEKLPWYKKYMPWLFRNKAKSNFRANILRRAHNAKNIRKS